MAAVVIVCLYVHYSYIQTKVKDAHYDVISYVEVCHWLRTNGLMSLYASTLHYNHNVSIFLPEKKNQYQVFMKFHK